eukprot:TRINITY_DN879_c0_g1_i3.p3 TRINITY_DN879_c0_g1~~TRINITY_DN879_c0_g1_i3.p3  ORF type:complete len:295 (-),score=74.54 TRINITY_DN879_c0_g1_i3:34-918(-)
MKTWKQVIIDPPKREDSVRPPGLERQTVDELPGGSDNYLAELRHVFERIEAGAEGINITQNDNNDGNENKDNVPSSDSNVTIDINHTEPNNADYNPSIISSNVTAIQPSTSSDGTSSGENGESSSTSRKTSIFIPFENLPSVENEDKTESEDEKEKEKENENENESENEQQNESETDDDDSENDVIDGRDYLALFRNLIHYPINPYFPFVQKSKNAAREDSEDLPEINGLAWSPNERVFYVAYEYCIQEYALNYGVKSLTQSVVDFMESIPKEKWEELGWSSDKIPVDIRSYFV